MLSILIPLYNYNVRELVEELAGQCARSGVEYEILCFDDASLPAYQARNIWVGDLPGVEYKLMPQNLGRSRIRNVLAASARYDYLLFMDCDSKVIRRDYIQKYLDNLDPGALVYGGRAYAGNPPADPELFLHWHYGVHREQMSVEERIRQPYHSFMTNNFLIPKALFMKIGFDERLTQYGHEDTLFGFELQQRKIPIKHIDNPLEHMGLEPADVFLDKTQKAVENLHFLAGQNLPVETRLLTTLRKLQSLKIAKTVFSLLKKIAPALQSNLHSAKPDLFYLDLYKLYLLMKMS
jgi:glycosyltransferase involved in cell wall biosynthesis